MNYQVYYFVGIGGIGMSALARYFHSNGKTVYGYDKTRTSLTDQLQSEGISINFENQVNCIPNDIIQNPKKTLIVYTAAIPTSHTILNYLQVNKYPCIKRAELLGILTKNKHTLAISGTHGKTSTSALAAHILYTSKQPMVAIIGGILKGYSTNLLSQGVSGQVRIVVEADEYDRSFLHLHPDILIITTVDPDHLDIYGNKSELYKAFHQLITQSNYCIIHELAAQELGVQGQSNVLIYGQESDNSIHAKNIKNIDKGSLFDYIHPHQQIITGLSLPLLGIHQLENSLAVITALLRWGISPEIIRNGLESFQGVQRRFDYQVNNSNCIFIDDYAHHPTEIRALLRTVRDRYPKKRLTAVFQPHLYSRTLDFHLEFAKSLCLADEVFLLDIYPAREKPIPGVSSKLILDKMSSITRQICSKDELLQYLQDARPELLVTIGAGDIGEMVPKIKDILYPKRN